jgi:hypothetical protein
MSDSDGGMVSVKLFELKARAFQPGDVGQINLYRAAVDDLLRHPDDQPTIGLLLCRGKNKLVVEPSGARQIRRRRTRRARRGRRVNIPSAA